MCPAIDNPASCEIHAVIHFLHSKNMSAVEIHHELCAICGQNVMSEGIVRPWCGMFKDGQTNFRVNFPQISLTVLYEIITVRLGYHKFCAR
jgi:hypothetical protein